MNYSFYPSCLTNRDTYISEMPYVFKNIFPVILSLLAALANKILFFPYTVHFAYKGHLGTKKVDPFLIYERKYYIVTWFHCLLYDTILKFIVINITIRIYRVTLLYLTYVNSIK